MGNCDEEIDYEVNLVIDQILREDRLESMGLNQCPDPCEPGRSEVSGEEFAVADDCGNSSVNCAVETSARFSIRILEALRAVQRRKCGETGSFCTMEEVVQYIKRNYYYDGDLCSQVETALNQVTTQGFVLKLGPNKYHLMGPFACILQPSVTSFSDESLPDCRAPRSFPGCKRRRGGGGCPPLANSTFAAPELGNSLEPIDQLPDISAIPGDRQDDLFQNRRNACEATGADGSSVAQNGGQEFEVDRTISVIRDIQRPPRRNPVRRPGGGIGRPDVRAQESSSDDNMYREEPANATNLNERSRRRQQLGARRSGGRDRSSSSGSSSDTITDSRCATRGSTTRKCESSSDADESEMDFDESDEEVKPWIEDCQKEDNQRFNRRGKGCSSSVYE